MQPFVKKQAPIALCVYMGQVLIGYSMGWTAPVVQKLSMQNQTTLPVPMTDTQASWAGSMLFVGFLVGPHITGYFSNVVGRKPCLLLGAIFVAISFIMVVFTGNIATIYALRAIQGLGSSIISVGCLVYIGEISSPEIRGILLSCTALFTCVGTLVVYSVGPYISYRATGYIGLLICLLFITGLFFIPESPIYYVIKDKDEVAQKIINKLSRAHETDLIKSTKISLVESRKTTHRWVQLFNQKSNRKAMFILISLGIFQQLSGFNAVLFYATTIFELAGSSIRSDVATIINGVTQLLAACIIPIFVERAGRRSILLVSTFSCTLSLAALATYFYLDNVNHASVGKISWLPLVTLTVFLLSYAGLGVIPPTITGEMFSINVRSTGSGLTNMVGSSVGFIVTMTFAYALALGAHYVFIFFSVSCAVAFLFTIFFVPETKGKSLTEIEEMLGK